MAALQSAAQEAATEQNGKGEAAPAQPTSQMPATDEEKAASAQSNFQAAVTVVEAVPEEKPVESAPKPVEKK